MTDASNLINNDTNGYTDIYLRAWQSNSTEIISIDSSGTLANGPSFSLSISGDGRFVAFQSDATNLVPGDTNDASDIFVRDRTNGTTERVSISSSGVQGNRSSDHPAISSDGRYVAFESYATNLVPGGTFPGQSIFVHDRSSGVTELVSVDSSGVQANLDSAQPVISADGRYVAFASPSSNLVSGDTNNSKDVFLRDRLNGTTIRVSVGSGGVEGNGDSDSPAISADGLSVAFESQATNLIGWDTNAVSDIYFRAWQLDYTEIISVDSNAALANNASYGTSISPDGRLVTFKSFATNLVPGDTNANGDVFLRDRSSGTTERISVSSGGIQGNGASGDSAISADGRFVAFGSLATNLVQGDTNGVDDIFLRDRAATGFTSVCYPDIDGVIACPCSNPPGSSGRGCDNSSGTGGAIFSASGIAYLSMDSLVFTTSGEKPTATSVLLQGTSSPASGVVYGQGVRCVGGTLKRLFTKAASGGSITAPNFGAGDPTVSARSAARGSPISAGDSRYYLVFYRDPVVLGGCPSSSTFNCTQTGRIDWNP